MKSEAALLTLDKGLKIETQPKNYTTQKGKNADFFVSVSGGKTPYTFEWYYHNGEMTRFAKCKDAAEWYERFTVDDDGGNYSVLTVREVGEYMEQNGSSYACRITDADGNEIMSDSAVLTVKD